jgi:integrase
MRRGEVAGLTWRHLDLDAARLRVEQQLVPTNRGGAAFGPPKSRRSERTIALDAATVAPLHHRRETQQLERDLAGTAYADQDLVFCDELGGPINPQRLTEWFRGDRKAAGIPTGTLHILRHTAAAIALTEGVPLHVVAGRLGDDRRTLLGDCRGSLLVGMGQQVRVHARGSRWRRPETAAGGFDDKPLTNRPESPYSRGVA